MSELDYWVFQGKEALMVRLARKAVEVVDLLLRKDIPQLVVEAFLKYMGRKRNEVQKELDHPAADKLFRFIPPELILNYLNLFEVRLTDSEYMRYDPGKRSS